VRRLCRGRLVGDVLVGTSCRGRLVGDGLPGRPSVPPSPPCSLHGKSRRNDLVAIGKRPKTAIFIGSGIATLGVTVTIARQPFLPAHTTVEARPPKGGHRHLPILRKRNRFLRRTGV
jgi:hypothetical protein